MAKSIFKHLPIVQYANTVARNILSRAKIQEPVMREKAAFYPYELPDSKRPDVLAFQYYDDPHMDWLVYMSNEVIDPYYETYLSYEQLNKNVAKKYGSVHNAKNKIRHWEVKWADQNDQISVDEFRALYTEHKKYWRPVLDEFDNALHYVRKEFDATRKTNQIVKIEVVDGSGFTIDENVTQTTGGVISAKGNVDYANNTHIVLKHIEGSFANTISVTGLESEASQTVLDVEIMDNPIPADELTYWTAVTYFDYEDGLNERRKSINLLNAEFADQAYQNLKLLMKK